MKPKPLRLDLSTYPHRLDMSTRFADVDPQWHLNNVRIAEFYQEGRVSFNQSMRQQWQVVREKGSRTLVARQTMDYLAEVKWPGQVTIGVGVAHVGGKSFTLALGMFQEGRCTGISDAILVHANREGPAPIPDVLRAALLSQMIPEAAR